MPHRRISETVHLGDADPAVDQSGGHEKRRQIAPRQPGCRSSVISFMSTHRRAGKSPKPLGDVALQPYAHQQLDRAAGGMRRVRRNAASKFNNGRCTSQNNMSLRRASGESCAIAASRRRRSSLSKAARSTSSGRRKEPRRGVSFARAPRPMPRYWAIACSSRLRRRDTFGNSRARLVPEAPSMTYVAPWRACATLQFVSGLLPA